MAPSRFAGAAGVSDRGGDAPPRGNRGNAGDAFGGGLSPFPQAVSDQSAIASSSMASA